MSNKKGLLPIISQEVGNSITAEILQTNGDKYMLDLLQRLGVEDNPGIANYVNIMMMQAKIPDTREAILYAALGVYRLLESQAEADKMNRELE